MRQLDSKIKLFIVILIAAISISLNFLTLLQAYPETQKIDSGCCAPRGTLLAKDFSAFYFGAWSLIHDPSDIYQKGSTINVSFLGIYPHPESYKYLPSFLILMLPFLVTSYSTGLETFDVLQFIMLFLIAYLVYRLLQGRNIAIVGIVSVIALLLPFSTIPSWGISEAYFWQWAEGQDKVLDLVLILFALYFGMKKRPILSGIFLGLSFFDPRFALLVIPLFLTLNKGRVTRASLVTIVTLLVSNLPMFVFPGVFGSFVQILFSGGAATPLYYYSYIPLLTILALSIAKWKEIAKTFSHAERIELGNQR